MKNKILTSLMAATMVMGSAMPVFAATTAQQTVNQTEAETTWSSTEVNVATTGTTKTGNISATGLTSGSWKGTFNFSVAMSDVQ